MSSNFIRREKYLIHLLKHESIFTRVIYSLIMLHRLIAGLYCSSKDSGAAAPIQYLPSFLSDSHLKTGTTYERLSAYTISQNRRLYSLI